MKSRFLFYYIFLLLLLCGPTLLYGQTQGKPFLRNYLPKEYGGHVQNWAIVQDSRGIMYFGNGNGLMSYDGTNWRILELPNQVTVRSMVITDNDLIYIGGVNTFGCYTIDKNGNGVYKRLEDQLPDSLQNEIDDIWETHSVGDAVFFRSYQHLFRYQNQKFTFWKATDQLRMSNSFVVGGEYYVHERKNRTPIYKVRKVIGDELVVVPDNDQFKGKSSFTMIPYKKDTVILGYAFGRLYKYPFSANPEADVELLSDLNAKLRQHSVYTDATKTAFGYVMGTFNDGLLVFDHDYKFVRRIGADNNGLRNLGLYYVYEDRDGAIWGGGANGVARVDLAGEISFWDKSSGIPANIYWIKRHQKTGVLYVATAAGLYYFEDNTPKLVTRTLGNQCWHLLNYTNPDDPTDQRLLLSTSVISELENGELKVKLVYENGVVFKMVVDKEDPYRVWTAFGDGFGSIYFENGQWREEERIAGAESNNRSVVQDENGDIWLGTFRSGVIRLIKDGEKTDISSPTDDKIKKRTQHYQVKRYTTEEGVSSNKNVLAFEVDNQILFGTDKGICKYNPETDRFEPYTKFGDIYANGQRDVFSMQEDANGNVWLSGLFTSASPAVVMEKQADGSYKKNTNPFKKVPPMMTLGMTIEEDGTAWLGGSEGLYRYKAESQSTKKEASYPTLIRKVIVGKDSVLFGGNYTKTVNGHQVASLSPSQAQNIVLPYAYNTIAFQFTAPFYDNESETQFMYYLEGFDEGWGPWEKKREKEYNNLKGGTYTFHIKSKNLYGDESAVTSYPFTVEKPIYLQWWAILAYIILGFILIASLIKWNSRRLEKENERLEGIITERTTEVRKQNEMLQQQKEEILTQSEETRKANDRILLKNTELNQQKEEILAQAENLRELNHEISAVNSNLTSKQNELEKAYDDIQNLSDIGQTITSTLDIRKIIRIVYENVNELMDASGFGIGVYEERENILNFKGYIEKGETLADHYEIINDQDSSIAIKVFNSGEMYFSNDLETDFISKGEKLDVLQGEVPLSLVYLPLTYNDQRVGVLTVQSFTKNAYSEKEVNILNSLASYATIALANAQGYEVIQSKNKNITDSIRYSQTMQNAFLPSRKVLANSFPNHFLLFYPRDIVSGDFYWIADFPELNKRFLAVVDCTGHGVPGSFMSIVGSTLLNQIINIQQVHNPAQILEELNQRVINTLSQDEHTNDDGMDVCLCLFEKEEDGGVQLTYSGAKRDLYYITPESDELQVLNGDRKLIGGRQRKEKHFTNQVLNLQAGDHVYLSTDGLVDQHNQLRKKFGTLRLKHLLTQLASKPIKEQGEVIDQAFLNFKGIMEQRDDVTLIGITVGKEIV